MTILHKFRTTQPDGADPTKVRASNWNDDHIVDGLEVVNNTSPDVGPEINYTGYRAKWYSGIDVANSPTSRDFVMAGVRDTYSISDGATTNGSSTLTSASDGNFVAEQVGAGISGPGIPGGTTILAVGGLTNLTMSANATATGSGLRVTITRATSHDMAYWKDRGGLTPTLGIGVTPPDGSHRLQVSGQDDEPGMGALLLRRSPSQTGNVFTVRESGGTNRMWIDKDYVLSGLNAAFGGAICIKADATNNRPLLMADNTSSSVYGFHYPGGNALDIRYVTGGTDILRFQSDGGLRHLSALLGLFGVTPVGRQTVTELTDNTGGTTDSTLQAIPDPTDSPASADALRDDIVANVLPAIRNNLADLAAKLNAIRAALVALGPIQ